MSDKEQTFLVAAGVGALVLYAVATAKRQARDVLQSGVKAVTEDPLGAVRKGFKAGFDSVFKGGQ